MRTDTEAKPQEGISCLLIDMHAPGVEVRPIVTIDGGREINTVYFTDVGVPVEDRIGEENRGWTYAKFLLGHERFGIARLAESKARLRRLWDIARSHRVGGALLAEDPDFIRSVAEAEIELTALEYTQLRALMNAEQGGSPGIEANMLKIRGTELQQKISEMLMKAVGYYAAPHLPEAMEYGWNEAPVGPEYAAALAQSYFNTRKTTILRWCQRDSAQHYRQDRAGHVNLLRTPSIRTAAPAVSGGRGEHACGRSARAARAPWRTAVGTRSSAGLPALANRAPGVAAGGHAGRNR